MSLKLENLQFTGSFKDRGALVRLLVLADAKRTRGIVRLLPAMRNDSALRRP